MLQTQDMPSSTQLQQFFGISLVYYCEVNCDIFWSKTLLQK